MMSFYTVDKNKNTNKVGAFTVINIRYATRKAAKEAAARANRGYGNRKVISDGAHGKDRMNRGTANEQQKKDQHNKNYKGDNSSHFHSTDAKGDKLQDRTHHLHPK